MRIRAAGLDDVAALARLNAEVHDLHLAARPHLYRAPTTTEIEEWFRGVLEERATQVLLAEQDGAAVGYVIVRQIDFPGHTFAHPRRMAEVDQVCVTASARRGGVGRALMAAAEVKAREWAVSALVLSVVDFNADALLFYRALGYDTLLTRLAKPL